MRHLIKYLSRSDKKKRACLYLFQIFYPVLINLNARLKRFVATFLLVPPIEVAIKMFKYVFESIQIN